MVVSVNLIVNVAARRSLTTWELISHSFGWLTGSDNKLFWHEGDIILAEWITAITGLQTFATFTASSSVDGRAQGLP